MNNIHVVALLVLAISSQSVFARRITAIKTRNQEIYRISKPKKRLPPLTMRSDESSKTEINFGRHERTEVPLNEQANPVHDVIHLDNYYPELFE